MKTVNKGNILVVDDDIGCSPPVCILKDNGYRFSPRPRERKPVKFLETPSLTPLSWTGTSDSDGISLLKMIYSENRFCRWLCLLPTALFQSCRSHPLGAYDFFENPLLQRNPHYPGKCLRSSRLEKEKSSCPDRWSITDGGISPKMQQLFEMIESAARIRGIDYRDSGTGKELVAGHSSAQQPGWNPMITVNCAAIPWPAGIGAVRHEKAHLPVHQAAKRQIRTSAAVRFSLMKSGNGLRIQPKVCAPSKTGTSNGWRKRLHQRRCANNSATNRDLKAAVQRKEFREDFFSG